jgi:hypothetical protein
MCPFVLFTDSSFYHSRRLSDRCICFPSELKLMSMWVFLFLKKKQYKVFLSVIQGFGALLAMALILVTTNKSWV